VTAVNLTSATEPGVYELDDAAYFGGPLARESLSSTGVRELLTCPAKFRYRQQHGRPDTRAFDVGHAAHYLVLGAGPELVRIDADKWLTKAVKEDVQAARERGAVPLRPSDWDTVHAMAAALQDHPHAPKLFSRGVPERTLVWRDEATGVLCRCKADWLRPDGIVDYKTCDSAELESLRKGVYNFGYYIQAPFYLRGFAAVLPVEVPFFAFVAQEKDPPYLVQTFQLSERALAYGDRKCAEALATYAACVEADEWPGYPTDDIPEIDLPAWVRTEEY
jgi:PDDEXK-like domain of unknown function (DUF3799)